jgi:arsenate reductase-like glutaredoxin family protein
VQLAREASEIYATKGKKVLHLNLEKDQPGDDEIAALVVGPSGKLRAPALRVGDKLLVGFDEEMYARIIG